MEENKKRYNFMTKRLQNRIDTSDQQFKKVVETNKQKEFENIKFEIFDNLRPINQELEYQIWREQYDAMILAADNQPKSVGKQNLKDLKNKFLFGSDSLNHQFDEIKQESQQTLKKQVQKKKKTVKINTSNQDKSIYDVTDSSDEEENNINQENNKIENQGENQENQQNLKKKKKFVPQKLFKKKKKGLDYNRINTIQDRIKDGAENWEEFEEDRLGSLNQTRKMIQQELENTKQIVANNLVDITKEQFSKGIIKNLSSLDMIYLEAKNSLPQVKKIELENKKSSLNYHGQKLQPQQQEQHQSEQLPKISNQNLQKLLQFEKTSKSFVTKSRYIENNKIKDKNYLVKKSTTKSEKQLLLEREQYLNTQTTISPKKRYNESLATQASSILKTEESIFQNNNQSIAIPSSISRLSIMKNQSLPFINNNNTSTSNNNIQDSVKNQNKNKFNKKNFKRDSSILTLLNYQNGTPLKNDISSIVNESQYVDSQQQDENSSQENSTQILNNKELQQSQSKYKTYQDLPAHVRRKYENIQSQFHKKFQLKISQDQLKLRDKKMFLREQKFLNQQQQQNNNILNDLYDHSKKCYTDNVLEKRQSPQNLSKQDKILSALKIIEEDDPIQFYESRSNFKNDRTQSIGTAERIDTDNTMMSRSYQMKSSFQDKYLNDMSYDVSNLKFDFQKQSKIRKSLFKNQNKQKKENNQISTTTGFNKEKDVLFKLKKFPKFLEPFKDILQNHIDHKENQDQTDLLNQNPLEYASLLTQVGMLYQFDDIKTYSKGMTRIKVYDDFLKNQNLDKFYAVPSIKTGINQGLKKWDKIESDRKKQLLLKSCRYLDKVVQVDIPIEYLKDEAEFELV